MSYLPWVFAGMGRDVTTGFFAVVLWLVIENLPVVQETQEMHVWSLGREDPLAEGMPTHSGILARKIPWTEEPGGLQSIGSQRVGYDWSSRAQQNMSTRLFGGGDCCSYFAGWRFPLLCLGTASFSWSLCSLPDVSGFANSLPPPLDYMRQKENSGHLTRRHSLNPGIPS